MHAQLHDLRLLYLAHQVEETFEGLEKALNRHLPPEFQTVLEPLFQGGPDHAKLDAKLTQLGRKMEAEQANISVSDLLHALRDCERMAQAFYLDHMADLSDPELVQLFRGLAGEEGRHLAAVEKAITMSRGMEYGRAGAGQ